MREKAAAKPGATPLSINEAVARAKPFIERAAAQPVKLSDIASNNIKALGYDVAYNSVIPVLGLATKAVENGEFNDVGEALGNAAFGTAVSAIIP